jgi:hypothetical protein
LSRHERIERKKRIKIRSRSRSGTITWLSQFIPWGRRRWRLGWREKEYEKDYD